MISLEALFPVAEAKRWTETGAGRYRPAAVKIQTRRFRRLTATFAGCSVLGVLLGVMLAVALPYVVHGRAFTVMSGSMEPAIHVGDVVVDERISPLDALVGDVVTFRDPHGSHRAFTHRVRKITISRGYANFITKGDANNSVERWTVRADGSIGRVRYRLPHLGYALFYMHTPWGRIVFVILPLTAAAIFLFRRIWR